LAVALTIRPPATAAIMALTVPALQAHGLEECRELFIEGLHVVPPDRLVADRVGPLAQPRFQRGAGLGRLGHNAARLEAPYHVGKRSRPLEDLGESSPALCLDQVVRIEALGQGCNLDGLARRQ